jgi:hypothetical protein
MLRAVAIVGFLSIAIALNAGAHDSDRIAQLEKELQETKLRLSKLEALLSDPIKVQEVVGQGEGWKSVASWRRLATNMEAGEVRRILGEPQKLDGGTLARWQYQNGGEVWFSDGKVHRWTEPRNWK